MGNICDCVEPQHPPESAELGRKEERGKKAEPKAEPQVEAQAEPKVEPQAEPKAEPKAEPQAEQQPKPSEETKPEEPKPEEPKAEEPQVVVEPFQQQAVGGCAGDSADPLTGTDKPVCFPPPPAFRLLAVIWWNQSEILQILYRWLDPPRGSHLHVPYSHICG